MTELTELLEVVDENDQVIGQATRGECYQKGLLHRAVNIFILNSQGEVYLQKRSMQKLIYPGRFDISASEHVKPGEPYLEAAKRGLHEELGISVEPVKVRPVHNLHYPYKNKGLIIDDNELVETYRAVCDGKFKLDSSEVSEGSFLSRELINQMIKEDSGQFTDYFLEEWSNLRKQSL